MKRALLVMCAVLVGAGLAVLGDEEDTTTSEFEIPPEMVLTTSDDLDFPDGSSVTEPEFAGWQSTNTLGFVLKNNQPVTVTGTITPFTHEDGKVLLTNVQYQVDRGTLPIAPLGNTEHLQEKYVHSGEVNPGYHEGRVNLVVLRDGYFDPAGKYEAVVKVTCTFVG